MLSQSLQELLNDEVELPTLPDVIIRLLSAVDNPESTAPDVARIISSDPALMTKVLKLVNSPFYGMPRQIATLTQATVVMGFAAIRNVALTIAVFNEFGRSDGKPLQFEFTREKFWEHSIAVAMMADTVAAKAKYSKNEDAFIAGLLHDIGKIVFDRYLHDDFIAVLTLADASGMSIFDAEKNVLGESHAYVGSWLADRWRLPAHLVDAMRHHHAPQDSEVDWPLVAIIHIADKLVRQEGYGHPGDNLTPEIDQMTGNKLGLEAKDYSEITQLVKLNFDAAMAFFQSVL